MVLDLIAYLLGLLFFGMLAWYGSIMALQSWELKEVEWGLIRYPIYPVKTIMALGLIWMTIQVGIRVFESGTAVVKFLRGR